jgi:hypothetical protein
MPRLPAVAGWHGRLAREIDLEEYRGQECPRPDRVEWEGRHSCLPYAHCGQECPRSGEMIPGMEVALAVNPSAGFSFICLRSLRDTNVP